jgi:hypothetical protein
MNGVASDRFRFAFIDEKGGKGPGFRDSTGEAGAGGFDARFSERRAGGREVFPARFFSPPFSRLQLRHRLSLGYGGLTRRLLRVVREMGHARTLSDQLLPGDPVAVTLPSPLAAPL